MKGGSDLTGQRCFQIKSRHRRAYAGSLDAAYIFPYTPQFAQQKITQTGVVRGSISANL